MKIIQAVLFGILFVLASVILLFWGEGRAVATARALAEGAKLVISVDASSVDTANEGKLVHVSGNAVPQDVPADQQFGIAADGAIALRRKVEMLQWTEIARDVKQTGSDGSTINSTQYSYEKKWASSPIDSSSFRGASAPVNPPMPVEGESFVAALVELGAFSVAGQKLASLASFRPVALNDRETRQAAAAIGSARPIWLVNDIFISADDPGQPQIGDLKVSFARGDVSTVSVIGKQQGGRVTDYSASNGKDIFLAENGTVPADAMFKTAIENNIVLTWVLRGVGLLTMLIGFALIFSPLTETLGRLPFVGGLINGGVMLAAVAMTLLLGGVVIGIGWIFFRPLLGIAIIVGGVSLAYGLGKLAPRKTSTA